MPAINLKEIEDGMPGITPTVGKQLYEACMCCLHRSEHEQRVIFNTHKEIQEEVEAYWVDEFTEQVDRTWQDQECCTEEGAICVSALMVKNTTEYTIIERSRKGTGFDYWLGKEDGIPFQKSARLEVSGIFKGDSNTIKQRYQKKVKQTKPSDDTGLKAYISIVEFSQPFLIFAQKD